MDRNASPRDHAYDAIINTIKGEEVGDLNRESAALRARARNAVEMSRRLRVHCAAMKETLAAWTAARKRGGGRRPAV